MHLLDSAGDQCLIAILSEPIKRHQIKVRFAWRLSFAIQPISFSLRLTETRPEQVETKQRPDQCEVGADDFELVVIVIFTCMIQVHPWLDRLESKNGFTHRTCARRYFTETRERSTTSEVISHSFGVFAHLFESCTVNKIDSFAFYPYASRNPSNYSSVKKSEYHRDNR